MSTARHAEANHTGGEALFPSLGVARGGRQTMDTATLQALWRQCAPPTRPWHNDAGESAMLHLRVAHYLRHLAVQLHKVLRDTARVRWETYDRAHAAGHVGLCGISIAPAGGR